MTDPQVSGEQIRFHAAGHLAAAVAVANDHPAAASAILGIVRAFLDSPKIASPPAFMETLDRAIADPVGELRHVAALEAMFCHPSNTTLEAPAHG